MSDIRDEKQREAKEAFLKTDLKATILGGTGIGKSKVAIDIIKELGILDESKTNRETENLLLVSSERLRDNDWKENFVKFDANWNVIVPECYQTAYKWTGRHFRVVIADEFDFALTDEYSSFFKNNTYDVLIALTAYIPDSKRELADSIAPVCFRYSTQEAQEDGLLNKTRFIQVNFDLTFEKNIKVEMKKGGFFMQSENSNYIYLDEQIQKEIIIKSIAQGDITKKELLNIDTTEVEKKLAKSSARLDFLVRKRRQFLHTLESSRLVTRRLIDKVERVDNDAKILVFSKLTEQSGKICTATYNSKNKKDNDNIGKLNSGELRVLGACEAMNRGQNLVGVNHIIKESYVGSDTDFQQQHGRGVRLRPDQIVTFFILVPHYWCQVAVEKEGKKVFQWKRFSTQAAVWMKNMTSEFKYEPEIIEVGKDGVIQYDNLQVSS